MLPISVDVAFVKSMSPNYPLDYLCRESCRGSGNTQQKNGASEASTLVPLKECGSRDSKNSSFDRWVAHASCNWSVMNMHMPPAQAARELTQAFLKILGMTQ